jgi:hypothetical protein
MLDGQALRDARENEVAALVLKILVDMGTRLRSGGESMRLRNQVNCGNTPDVLVQSKFGARLAATGEHRWKKLFTPLG